MSATEHCYNVTECPRCGHDLTSDAGVVIAIADPRLLPGEVTSRLDENGWLEDVDDVLADGLHGDTLCYECNATLNEYENFDAEDESP